MFNVNKQTVTVIIQEIKKEQILTNRQLRY